MNDRWVIHKTNYGMLGPFKAEEIRDGLKQGNIDPFEYLSREDGSDRQMIIECKDLLNSSPAPDNKVQSKTRDSIYNAENVSQGDDSGATSPTVALPNTPITFPLPPRTPPPPPAPKSSAFDDVPRRQVRYAILDKRGKNLGLFSANDIRNMYFRGVIGSQHWVGQHPGELKVPAVKFVSIIAGMNAAQFKPARTNYTPRLVTRDARLLYAFAGMFARRRQSNTWFYLFLLLMGVLLILVMILSRTGQLRRFL